MEGLKNVRGDFELLSRDFDLDMDHLANQADYNRINKEFEIVFLNSTFPPYFLKASKFNMPKFEFIKSDIEDIMQIGRIADMSEFNEPIIAVNTFTLEIH
jgi:hypothetical protein